MVGKRATIVGKLYAARREGLNSLSDEEIEAMGDAHLAALQSVADDVNSVLRVMRKESKRAEKLYLETQAATAAYFKDAAANDREMRRLADTIRVSAVVVKRNNDDIVRGSQHAYELERAARGLQEILAEPTCIDATRTPVKGFGAQASVGGNPLDKFARYFTSDEGQKRSKWGGKE